VLTLGLDQITEFMYRLDGPLDVIGQNDAHWTQWVKASVSANTSPSLQQKAQRPKRKRKPQKPGKTAKLNDRHFVVHNYHDRSHDVIEDLDWLQQQRKGGISVSFPLRLHEMLDQIESDGLAHVISWQPHGRAFLIHNPKEFTSHVMPKYFKQTKLTSFQRQLNLYGFCRLTKGLDNRGYYHEFFLRGKPYLCSKMTRVKVKGTGFKAASSPDQEPDFYAMPPVLVTPPDSGASDEGSVDEEENQTMHGTERRPQPMYDSNWNGGMEYSPSVNYIQEYQSPSSSFDDAHNFNDNVIMSPNGMRSIQSSFQYDDPLLTTPIIMSENHETIGDMVMNEAIDELFVDDVMRHDETLEDFVDTWATASAHCDLDDLESDLQLGNFLKVFMA
jgi:hypothetical protein